MSPPKWGELRNELRRELKLCWFVTSVTIGADSSDTANCSYPESSKDKGAVFNNIMIINQPEPDPLTGREQDVLRLMTDGQTNREIASELVVSIETVRWYTKQIYGKLGVHSRTQAVLRSRELGLFKAQSKGYRQPSPKPIVQLPQYATPFVGRQQILQEVGERLAQPDVRLITIAGPGGTGKTRLCVELARRNSGRFAGGVCFVPLAPLDSIEEATAEVAHQLGMRFSSNQELGQQLAAYLRDKPLLLVLDNMEHLPNGSAWVGALLSATRRLKLLVSSQASLNLSAEWVRYLQGVPYPDRLTSDAGEYAAVQLFMERAQRVSADFDENKNLACVVEICRLLYGVPLALELAAAWLKSLSCAQIVTEIKESADFLITRHTDIEARHYSLQAVFDYSWKLLTDRERRVLLRLSPFRDGFSRKTAEEVAGADLPLLSSLVDKSFLIHTDQGNYLFHELLRLYAADLLEKQGTGTLTTRSGKLLLWSLFMKGDFGRAEQLAADILVRSVPGTVEQAFGLALMGLLAGMQEDYGRCHEMGKVAFSLVEKIPEGGDPLTQVFVHLALAVASCGFGEYEQTRNQTAIALDQAVQMQSPAFALLCLPLTAVFMAHIAETEQAVQLLALAFNHPAHTSAWLEKWPLLTQLASDMAAELGTTLYTELWQKGRTIDLDTTVTGLLTETFRKPQ